MTDYKSKYLKYKLKYQKLIGGMETNDENKGLAVIQLYLKLKNISYTNKIKNFIELIEEYKNIDTNDIYVLSEEKYKRREEIKKDLFRIYKSIRKYFPEILPLINVCNSGSYEILDICKERIEIPNSDINTSILELINKLRNLFKIIEFDFSNVNLTNVDLSYLNLSNTQFYWKLLNTNFTSSVLVGCLFHPGQNFGDNLNFTNANLKNSVFINKSTHNNFTNINFTNANLEGVDFTNCTLINPIFTNAKNLDKTIGLSQEIINKYL